MGQDNCAFRQLVVKVPPPLTVYYTPYTKFQICHDNSSDLTLHIRSLGCILRVALQCVRGRPLAALLTTICFGGYC